MALIPFVTFLELPRVEIGIRGEIRMRELKGGIEISKKGGRNQREPREG